MYDWDELDELDKDNHGNWDEEDYDYEEEYDVSSAYCDDPDDENLEAV